jgi:adiponectin receptor
METISPEKKPRSEFHEIMQSDNKYLFSGYRYLPIQSTKKCFKSIFSLHNETLNIWTHIISLIIYLSSIRKITEIWKMDKEDYLFFLLFLLSACTTYIFSVLYHTLRSNSIEFYNIFLGCDLRGIILLIAASNIFSGYFDLKCYQFEKYAFVGINLIFMIFLFIWTNRMVKYRLTNQRTLYFSIFSCLR